MSNQLQSSCREGTLSATCSPLKKLKDETFRMAKSSYKSRLKYPKDFSLWIISYVFLASNTRLLTKKNICFYPLKFQTLFINWPITRLLDPVNVSVLLTLGIFPLCIHFLLVNISSYIWGHFFFFDANYVRSFKSFVQGRKTYEGWGVLFFRFFASTWIWHFSRALFSSHTNRYEA